MFGDSLVAGYNLAPDQALPKQLEAALQKDGLDAVVENFGVSGDTTYSALQRTDLASDKKPKIIVIVLGGNDMLRNVPPEQTYENLENIIKRFQEKNIRVILCEMKASTMYGLGFKSKFDSIYSKLARKYSVKLVPFFMEKVIYDQTKMLSDGIHPNALGVAQIVQDILPIIKKEIKEVK